MKDVKDREETSKVKVKPVAKPLDLRIYITTARDMAFYRKLVTEYAPQYRFNIINIYSIFEEKGSSLGASGFPNNLKYFMAEPLWYCKYPKIYEARKDVPILRQAIENLKELSTLAAERDIKILYTFPIVHYHHIPSESSFAGKSSQSFLRSAHPEYFKNGQLDFNSPLVHQFVKDQIGEYFELYPDLAGLFAHSGEMATFCPSYLVRDTSQLDAIILSLMEIVYTTCRKHGKMVLWDMHSAAGDRRNADAIIKALKTGRFPEIVTCTETTWTQQHFSLTYPTTYLVKDMIQCGHAIFYQDCYGEGLDFPFIPFIVDQYLVRHFRACEKAGAKGGGVMWGPYQGRYHQFNTLQNINLELQTRMMMEGGDIDPEQVKREWIEKHYGERAAPHLLRAFNRVNLILSRIFYIAENGWWGLPTFPSFSTMVGGTYFWWIEFFSKPETPLKAEWTRRTASVRAIPMKQMRQEKQEAVRECELALRDLAKAKGKMKDEDYNALLARFVALWYYARACQIVLEVGYYFKNTFLPFEPYPEAKDPERDLEEAAHHLKALVDKARADSRLKSLEEDVGQYGLEGNFLQLAEKFCQDLAGAFYIIVNRPLF